MLKRLISGLSAVALLFTAVPVSALELRGTVEDGATDYTGVWSCTSDYLPNSIELYRYDDELSCEQQGLSYNLQLQEGTKFDGYFTCDSSSRGYFDGEMQIEFDSANKGICTWGTDDLKNADGEDVTETIELTRTQDYLEEIDTEELPDAESFGAPAGLSMVYETNYIQLNYVNTPDVIEFAQATKEVSYYYTRDGWYTRFGTDTITPRIQFDARIDGGEWLYTEEWDTNVSVDGFEYTYADSLYDSATIAYLNSEDDLITQLIAEADALLSFEDENGEITYGFDYANHKLETRCRYIYEYYDDVNGEYKYSIGNWSDICDTYYDYDNNIVPEFPTEIEAPVIELVDVKYDQFFPEFYLKATPSPKLLEAAAQKRCDLSIYVEASLYDEETKTWGEYYEINGPYVETPVQTYDGLINNTEYFTSYVQDDFYARPASTYKLRARYVLDGYTWSDEVKSAYSKEIEMKTDELKAQPFEITIEGAGTASFTADIGQSYDSLSAAYTEETTEAQTEVYDDFTEENIDFDSTTSDYPDITLPLVTFTDEAPEITDEVPVIAPPPVRDGYAKQTFYVNEGDNLFFDFYPEEPTFEIDKVYVDNVDVTNVVLDNLDSFYHYGLFNIYEPHSIYVYFKPSGIPEYDVNITCGEHGTTYPETSGKVYEGYDFYLDLQPDEGYTADYIVFNGVKYVVPYGEDDYLSIKDENDNYIFSLSFNYLTAHNVTSDISIEVAYRLKGITPDAPFATVKVNNDSQHGSVYSENSSYNSDTNLYEITAGENGGITIDPNTFYAIDSILIDGTANEDAVKNKAVTFENVTEGETHTVDILYKRLPTNFATLTKNDGGTASISGGVYNGEDKYECLSGSNMTLEVVPTIGFNIESVTLNGKPIELTLNKYLISEITEDCVIDVKFAVTTFTITAYANDGFEGCAVSPTGNVKVPYGKDQTFTITVPEKGFYVSSIIVDGTAVDKNLKEYTFKEVLADHTISVDFEAEQIDVSYKVFFGNKELYKSSETVNYGTITSFDTTPGKLIPDGYAFDSAYLNTIDSPLMLTGTALRYEAIADAEIIINVIEKEIVVEPFKYGDLNGDGKVNITDVSILVKHVAQIKLLDKDKLAAADVNVDGKVNVTDLSRLVKYVALFDDIVLGA